MTYLIGRGKPPIETRFKKGQSGNPNGRPKKKITPLLKFMDELEAETMRVATEGKKKRKSGRQTMIEQLARKLARGSSDCISEVRAALKRYRHERTEQEIVVIGGLPDKD